MDYGAFMEVMNLLRAAGYLKIALVGLEQLPVAEQDTGEQDRAEVPGD